MKSDTKKPPDQKQRELILHELGNTMLVEAAAGTGKTTSMIGRMVALLASGKCDIEKMAAITFTRKAAAELRSRFQLELEKQARETEGKRKTNLINALAHTERCSIMTIHSFCARLLRERPIEAGLNVDFEELEPEADLRLREEAWNEHVATLYAENNPILAELAELGLEISQLKPVYTRLADYPDVDEWPAPAEPLPDLAPSAEALKKYAARMEKLARKFDDPGNDRLMPKYRLIPRMVRHADLSQPAELLKIIELMGGSPNIVQKNWPGGKETALKEKERWAKFSENFVDPLKNAFLVCRYEIVFRALKLAFKRYERTRLESGRLNYQDLLMLAADLLRDNPNVRKYFRRRLTHLLVDEFQDTDPVQAEVMLLLTAADPNEADWKKCRPAPGSLFVVGDPKQSIYRFRRADIVTYNRVKKIIEESGGMIVDLQANFRTTAPLVEWVNATFDDVFPAEADAYSPPKREMLVGRPDLPKGGPAGVNRIVLPDGIKHKGETIEYESDFIARFIRRALDDEKADAGDFMIITRNTTDLGAYAEALREYGIPHQVSGGSALNQVWELALLHTCLAAVVRPENPIALVAALRSELFGASDAQLYDYMKAGGEFSFRSKISTKLDKATREIFVNAFKTLGKYAEWFNKMPPVVAVEKIAADTGLPALAAAAPGGNEQAGSMGKAFEILRAAQADMWTALDVVEYLGQIVEREEKYDGVPARPPETDVVRVMNLHKVKGLEAPVVFLANPTDRYEPPPDFHIDRAGEKVRGYILIHGESSGYGAGPVLALPKDWEELAEEEKNFDDAEKNRLLYVAATRAGTTLNVITREKYRNKNPWDFFGKFLEECPAIEDPGEVEAKVSEKISVDPVDIETARKKITQRWKNSVAPTYATAAAKEISVAPKVPYYPTGEHGTEWGIAIHRLLQATMENPEADLRRLAVSSFEELGLDFELVDTALETVESVGKSEIWQRALAAPRRLMEAPFQVMLPDEEGVTGFDEVMVRGVIDLVFEENGGWVIVDYKTDDRAEKDMPKLIEHYRPQLETYAKAWEKCTGNKIIESGFFFVDSSVYAKTQNRF